MHKTFLALTAALMSVGLAGGAQAKFGDVSTSTDPATAAAVEQHAEALKARETHTMHSMHHASMHSMHSMKHHAKHVAHSHHPAKTPTKS
jgi:hypothetical protein